ncbi:hypothetical protein [Alkalibacillus aidingensis]|uniref:hypothetical protein n=1 Tax=Alkalibacillus aidingensis TaxID=2747607 RepID=UPI001660A54C|nr:hypothetical protein [Alkalibacillus aidingensis]
MSDINLKDFSNEELKDLKVKINEEMGNREDQEVIYSFQSCDNSDEKHTKENKHWVKLLKDVDTSKNNGYGVIGDFLKTRGEQSVKVDSLVVEYSCKGLFCYKVKEDEPELLVEGEPDKFVTFLKEIEKEL